MLQHKSASLEIVKARRKSGRERKGEKEESVRKGEGNGRRKR